MTGRWAKRVFFVAVVLFLAGPIAVVAGVSVNEKKTLTFPPQGFSLDWYAQIFTDHGWRSALIASVTIALAASIDGSDRLVVAGTTGTQLALVRLWL